MKQLYLSVINKFQEICRDLIEFKYGITCRILGIRTEHKIEINWQNSDRSGGRFSKINFSRDAFSYIFEVGGGGVY